MATYMTAEDQRRLNECAVRWKTTPAEGNEAARKSWFDEIWVILFRSYDSSFSAYERSRDTGRELTAMDRDPDYVLSEAFVETIAQTLEQFDPEKGHFSHYFNFVMSRRKSDSDSKDVLRNPGVLTVSPDLDDEDEGAEARNRRLEAEMAASAAQAENSEDDAGAVAKLLTQFYGFFTRKEAAADHEQSCCRMMVTDFLEDLIHTQAVIAREAYGLEPPTEKARKMARERLGLEAFEDCEQEIFDLFVLGFLDFFMEEQDGPHRTVRALGDHERKFEGELVPNGDMTRRAEPTMNKKSKVKNHHMEYQFYAAYAERSRCFEEGWVPSAGQFSAYNKKFKAMMDLVRQAL